MFERIYAKNLGNPRGIIGKKVSKWFEENIICYSYLLDIEDLSNQKCMLEIGYGNGEGLKLIADKCNGRIDGIEISKLMYKIASSSLKSYIQSGKVNLLCGNFELDVIDDRKYGFIFLMNVIYFWDDIEVKIRHLIELLDDNGKLMIFMASPKYLERGKISVTDIFRKHRIDDISQVFIKEGLKDLKVVEHNEEKECYYVFGTKIRKNLA